MMYGDEMCFDREFGWWYKIRGDLQRDEWQRGQIEEMIEVWKVIGDELLRLVTMPHDDEL